jgi:hypothetical protein
MNPRSRSALAKETVPSCSTGKAGEAGLSRKAASGEQSAACLKHRVAATLD